MRRSLRYEDAVKVLAGGDSQFVKVLDDVGSVLLFGAGVFDLFEAKAEALRLVDKLLEKFGEKLRGVDRLTRTERIHAAHEVIRITAYFDAFGAALSEYEVGFSAAEQAQLASGTSSSAEWRELYRELSETPLPSPVNHTDLAATHRVLSKALIQRLRALALWDALNDTEKDRLVDRLTNQVPGDATARYEEYLRRLAVDCPEFGVWLNLQVHAATREQLATGLAELERLLAPLAAGPTDAAQTALARAHRAALAKPIVLTSGPEAGLALPSLGEGYVNHRFRLAFTRVPPGQEWEERPVRHDLPQQLAAYLLSTTARTVPMLVLGQPGSGKSVLTRILAARLPAQHFLPIRVELRHVDADADLQAHIESAIRAQTGEHVQWTRFVRENPDLLPVVILDGFDELLQATGVAQTDFLLRVERFQERELDQGRSVAVLVTSRTAVADRATIPAGSPIIRLEPFDGEQIETWIEIWNRTNSSSLLERGVKPLAASTVSCFRTLAEQPLLLLMLALYDATDNALAAVDPSLDPSAVYEQLLQAFAHRELTKDLDTTDIDRRVEQELLRLSIVAFAMFNRGTQWIDDASLTEDLRDLKIWESERNTRTMRSTLSAGQQMVGRFFFVHDSRASRDGRELQTYEFLHATFSEYLIARLVDRLLVDLAQQHIAAAQSVSRSINDGLLHSLLSFSCLAARTPIVEFTGALISRHDPAVRRAMEEVLTSLFMSCMNERTDRTYADYQPISLDIVERASNWSANLLLLMAFAPAGVSMRSLYAWRGDYAVDEWHRLSHMWRSCLRGASWNGLIDNLVVERTWLDGDRDIVVRVGTPVVTSGKADLTWSYHYPEASWQDGAWWDAHLTFEMRRRADFLFDRRFDLAMHNTLPLSDALPALGHTVYHTADGRLVTAINLLMSAMAAPYQTRQADSAILDLVRVLPLLSEQAAEHEKRLYAKLALGVITTAVELNAISPDARRELRELRIFDYADSTSDARLLQLRDWLVRALATAPAPPASEASPTPSPSPATSSPETPATPPAAP